jgi:hypothetical protein
MRFLNGEIPQNVPTLLLTERPSVLLGVPKIIYCIFPPVLCEGRSPWLDEKREKYFVKGEGYETKPKGQVSTSGYQGRITPGS